MRTWVHRNLLKPGTAPFAHQTDFEHAMEDAKPGQGVIAAHGTGCLSGSVTVKVNRARKTFTVTMADLYARFNGPLWQRRSTITQAQCHINGRVRLNEILDVYCTGEKEVFEVNAAGRSIRTTADHEYETPTGFRTLSELVVGDVVLVRGGRARKQKAKKPTYKQVKLANHPYTDDVPHPVTARDCARCGYLPGHVVILKRVPEHRLQAEAHLNGLSYVEFIRQVRSGDLGNLAFLDPAVFAVHHKDQDSRNNDPGNLEVLTHEEHHRQHAFEGGGEHVLEPVIGVPIDGIRPVGKEMTYDLRMLSPHNNYVANGFVVHNSGKTFSAIGAFEEMKGMGKTQRALVLTPAGLRTNFLEQGVHKYTTSKAQILTHPDQATGDMDYAIVSYDAFRRDPQAWMDKVKPDTIIADEVHRAGNPDGATNKAIWAVRPQVKYFMGLTASIAQNDPADIVPLTQLASGQRDGPYPSKKAFTRAHVKSEPTPGQGIFGGKLRTKRLVRREELYNRVGPYIHYVEDLDASQKPQEVSETIPVEMSSEQTNLYRLAMKGVDPNIRIKIEQGQPVSQKEAMGIFTSLLRARQASNSLNTVDPRLTAEQAADRTPKVRKVLDDVEDHLKSTPDGQIIVYTNMVHGGVDVLEAGLKKRGIKYGMFIGKGNEGVTEAGRQQAVTDYLAGKNKVIVITGAGAEGLSLGNTTMVQLLDGHYNPERIKQATARGIRAGGLSQRPIEDRKVAVKKYVSTLPKTFWQTAFFKPPDTGVDEWVYRTAGKKDALNRQLRDVLQRRSEHEEHKRDSFVYRHFGAGP